MSNTTNVYWDVNGVSLNQHAWNITTTGGDRNGVPGLRGDDVTIPFAPGDMWRTKVPDARTITLSMWVIGANQDGTLPSNASSKATFNKHWLALKKLLWTPRREILLTKRFVDEATGLVVAATARAQFAGGLVPTMQGTQRANFVVQLKLSDPFFYGAEETLTLPRGSSNRVIKGDYETNRMQVTLKGPAPALTLSNTSSNGDIYRWLGTPNNSRSVRTSDGVSTTQYFINPNLVGTGVWQAIRTNLHPNPNPWVSGTMYGYSNATSDSTMTIPEQAVRWTFKGTGPKGVRFSSAVGTEEGVSYRLLMRVRANKNLQATMRIAGTSSSETETIGVSWQWIDRVITAGSGSSSLSGLLVESLADGDWVEVARVCLEKTPVAGSGVWFDGANQGTSAGERDPDLRTSWTGTAHRSPSVLEGERVRGLTGQNAIALRSTWQGQPAVRVMPLSATYQPALRFTVPEEVRSAGTLIGTIHVPTSQSSSAVALRRLSVNAPVQRSDQAPQAPGTYPLRLTYSGLGDPNYAFFYGGDLIGQGGGDVYWTDIGLFSGTYSGNNFSGNTEGIGVEDSITMTYNSNLSSGQNVVADVPNFKATLGTSSVNRAALIEHSGSPFWMVLSPGTNYFNVIGSTGSSVEIKYRPAYL